MSVRSSILAVAAVAAGLATVTATPAVAGQLATIEVQFQDLNLANEAGRATLDRRIAVAARQACGDYMPVELKWRELSRACQADVIASAAPQRDALVGGERYAALRVSRAAN